VGGAGVLLVRRPIADVTLHDDQGRPVGRPLETAEGPLDCVEVVGVAHSHHIPVVTEEAGGDVLGEGEVGVALDGDLVAIVDPAEVREP
jgi:hypothetical protein